MRLKTGQYVRHSRFGWGTILDRDGIQTTVYFRSVGVKRLATSSAKFTMIGGEALKKRPVA